MFKKTLLVLVSAALLFAAVGCQCAPAATPSPSPSTSPSIMPTNEPVVSAMPEQSNAPNLSASPGLSASPAGNAEATIPNFKEGTEVKEKDVPEVKKAVVEKYKDAKIVSIKHAMQENRQVYAVEIELKGKKQTVYVAADGTLVEESTAANGAKSGGNG